MREPFKILYAKRIDALFEYSTYRSEYVFVSLEQILSAAFGFAQFGRVFVALNKSVFHLFIALHRCCLSC